MGLLGCNKCGNKKRVCKAVPDCFSEIKLFTGSPSKGFTVSVTRGQRVVSFQKFSDILGFVSIKRVDMPIGYLSINQGQTFEVSLEDEFGEVCLPICCEKSASTLVFRVIKGGVDTVFLNQPCNQTSTKYCERKYKSHTKYCERKYTRNRLCSENKYCERRYKSI